jgi:hypothetical protein
MFSTMAASAVTAKECLQSAEVCLALAHKTKELDTRAALLEIAYEFHTVAKCPSENILNPLNRL